MKAAAAASVFGAILLLTTTVTAQLGPGKPTSPPPLRGASVIVHCEPHHPPSALEDGVETNWERLEDLLSAATTSGHELSVLFAPVWAESILDSADDDGDGVPDRVAQMIDWLDDGHRFGVHLHDPLHAAPDDFCSVGLFEWIGHGWGTHIVWKLVCAPRSPVDDAWAIYEDLSDALADAGAPTDAFVLGNQGPTVAMRPYHWWSGSTWSHTSNPGSVTSEPGCADAWDPSMPELGSAPYKASGGANAVDLADVNAAADAGFRRWLSVTIHAHEYGDQCGGDGDPSTPTTACDPGEALIDDLLDELAIRSVFSEPFSAALRWQTCP